MQIVEINLVQPQIVNFAPKSIAQEVAQNIYNLLSTAKYTVPLDRNFGLSINYIDTPINLVQARLKAEIIQVIKLYEPRFIVQSIVFKPIKENGALYPVIRGGINGT